MKVRVALAAVVIVSLGFPQAPAAASHRDCTKQEPLCRDVRGLVQRSERQEVISRVLGHHCWHAVDEGQPNRDRREIFSQISVVFRDVTRDFGFLETVTVHFRGGERQIMGRIDAIGKRNDWNMFDGRPHDPGFKVSFRVDKKVEFADVRGKNDRGRYQFRHESAASGPAPDRPGPDPQKGGPPGWETDCHGIHNLILEVVPA